MLSGDRKTGGEPNGSKVEVLVSLIQGPPP